jgi:hypothetical protein
MKKLPVRKLLCLILACLLSVSSAAAAGLEDFSVYAEIFGAHEVENGDARDQYIRFVQEDGCAVTFELDGGEINMALVDGEGEAFLAYCLAAILQFDPDTKNATVNAGQLLTSYLLARGDGEEHTGVIASGNLFILRPNGDAWRFMIGNK